MVKRNPLIRSYPKRVNKPLPNKSAGILEDYSMRKVIQTKEGTITKTPVNDIDIANKKYVDDNVGVGTWTDTSTNTGTNKTFNSFTNFLGADEVHLEGRNESGSTMNKGDVVYISGYNVGLDKILISLADANGSGTYPAIGMVEDSSIANNADGHVIVTGKLSGFDTSAFSVGDTAYMSETAGELSVRPTARASQVQAMGIVLRSHASLGILGITGAGRTNDESNDVHPRITTAFWHTVNGYGSTNTVIQKFTTEVDASDDVVVTVVNSATLGFYITANMPCKLTVNFGGNYTSSAWTGISKNNSQLTTTITAITATDRLAVGRNSAANFSEQISWTGVLATNDVIRPHTDAATDGSNPELGGITIMAEEILS